MPDSSLTACAQTRRTDPLHRPAQRTPSSTRVSGLRHSHHRLALGAALLLTIATAGCSTATGADSPSSAVQASPSTTAAAGQEATTSPTADQSALAALAALDRKALSERVTTERECPTGDLTLDGAPEGEVVHVTGPCNITVPLRGTILLADAVGTLTVTAHDVLISTESVSTLDLSGDDIVVGWADHAGSPSVTDTGAHNVTGPTIG